MTVRIQTVNLGLIPVPFDGEQQFAPIRRPLDVLSAQRDRQQLFGVTAAGGLEVQVIIQSIHICRQECHIGRLRGRSPRPTYEQGTARKDNSQQENR